MFSFLIDKSEVDIEIDDGNTKKRFDIFSHETFDQSSIEKTSKPSFDSTNEKFIDVPLIQVAYGRSGDKGNKANIGIISRHEKFYPAICDFLNGDVVAKCFKKFLEGSVETYYLPGSCAINFVLNDVLGGGGPASLRNDPQGKAYAQILLDQKVPIPEKLL